MQVAGAVKNERDAGRAKMIADMKKKAKGKKQPSFEVLDVTPEERAKGEYVAAYQAKKQLEAQELLSPKSRAQAARAPVQKIEEYPEETKVQ